MQENNGYSGHSACGNPANIWKRNSGTALQSDWIIRRRGYDDTYLYKRTRGN